MCDRCGSLTFFGLAEPQRPMLESYAAALRSGWSPNNARDVSAEQLAVIEADPDRFLADLLDPNGTVTLADGRIVQRLAFRLAWIWDGEFCGIVNLRYQSGTEALPPYVSGHVGYAVVPWKRSHGYASRALRHILQDAREVGLRRAQIMIEPDNIASRIVAERNGAVRDGTYCHDGKLLDRFVVDLATEYI